MHSDRFTIFSICLLIFIDQLGIGIIFPIMPELFLNGQNGLISGESHHYRDLFYGIAFALYPLGAIFGMPVLGGLSDKFGRRSVILLSLAGLCFSYLLSAVAVEAHSLWLFLASRLSGGFFSGTFSIANAVISDVSKNADHKMDNFRWPILAALAGLVVGPSISVVIGWINPDTSLALPFSIAFVLSLLNLVLLFITFKPAYTQRLNHTHILENLSSIVYIFKNKEVKLSALSYLFFQFAFGLFSQSISMYLAQKFDYTPMQIGSYFAFMAFAMTLFILLAVQRISDRFHYTSIISFSMLALSAILFFQSLFLIKEFAELADPLYIIWISTLLLFLVYPLPTLSFTTYLSEKAGKSDQGRIMGGMGQLQSFALFISGVLVGKLVSNYEYDIYLMASLSTFIGYLFIKNDIKKDRLSRTNKY